MTDLVPALSTRYVVTTCCRAPVRLATPNFLAECADVVCVGCGRIAGTPGAEDSPDVEEFVRIVPIIRARPEFFAHSVGTFEWRAGIAVVPTLSPADTPR